MLTELLLVLFFLALLVVVHFLLVCRKREGAGRRVGGDFNDLLALVEQDVLHFTGTRLQHFPAAIFVLTELLLVLFFLALLVVVHFLLVCRKREGAGRRVGGDFEDLLALFEHADVQHFAGIRLQHFAATMYPVVDGLFALRTVVLGW